VDVLALRIRTELRARRDPARAEGAAAYMKVADRGSLPHLGVRRPEVRAIARRVAREQPVDDDAMVVAVHELWDDAAYAEERYAAQDLLGLPWARGRLDLLELHEHMALTGAWWDHVDEVAHRVADLVASHPDEMRPVLLAWSTHPSPWLRRLAIIGQLGRRDRVDRALLAAVIEPNVADPEFFVRKAIGWALREVARHDPDWVRSFADSHPLSPLSRREALKHLSGDRV
jgi:3-methyladenine DNA glycosylase AlkD